MLVIFSVSLFFQRIMVFIDESFYLGTHVNGELMEENLQQWYDGQNFFRYIFCFMQWEFWNARNISIFHNQTQNAYFICSKVISSFYEWNKENCSRNLKICSFPSIGLEYHVGFFYGVVMKGVCGARMVFKVGRDLVFK